MIAVLKNFYHYLQKPKSLGIGNSNYAFEPQYTLPAFDELGISQPAGSLLNVFQPPQVYVIHATTTAGIGGLISGQIINAPVYVPANKQGSNGL